MRVWIDASSGAARDRGLCVFGMTLLERTLRALAWTGAPLAEVRVDLGPGDAPAPALPADLEAALPVRFAREAGPAGERLARAVGDGGEGPWLALPGDAVTDARLLSHLLARREGVAFLSDPQAVLADVLGDRRGPGRAPGAALRIEGPLPPAAREADDLAAVARAALAAGEAKAFDAEAFDGHIKNLRRVLPAWVLPVRDPAERDRVERFLFWSNYKGSTDFLTRYVYPPVVWRLLRPLARRRVHPNAVTAVSIAATLAAIPFFAAGAWVTGLGLAYLMSVLDSVDGKLARLTFTASKLGDVLDHGLDIVHPPFWYLAWAWGLSGGEAGSALFQASLWLFGLYVFDRLLAPLFRWRTDRSIHEFDEVDRRLRTFISRRNVNLAVFTVALPLGLAAPAFYAIVAWQALSAAFHATRVVQCWNRRPAGAC